MAPRVLCALLPEKEKKFEKKHLTSPLISVEIIAARADNTARDTLKHLHTEGGRYEHTQVALRNTHAALRLRGRSAGKP